MNCYLLHIPRLPCQPASNVGGLVIHLTGLNWLDSTAMTRNNLCIISISLEWKAKASDMLRDINPMNK